MIPQTALLALGSTALPGPGAISAYLTTFTYSGGGGAAEANLFDDVDSTPSADPAGLQTSTSAAMDYGQSVLMTNLRVITASSFGFSGSATFRVQYNDTGLNGTWSNGPTFVIPAGTSQIVNVGSLNALGAHRYWRIVYDSAGSIGTNAWLGGIKFT